MLVGRGVPSPRRWHGYPSALVSYDADISFLYLYFIFLFFYEEMLTFSVSVMTLTWMSGNLKFQNENEFFSSFLIIIQGRGGTPFVSRTNATALDTGKSVGP